MQLVNADNVLAQLLGVNSRLCFTLGPARSNVPVVVPPPRARLTLRHLPFTVTAWTTGPAALVNVQQVLLATATSVQSIDVCLSPSDGRYTASWTCSSRCNM
ncbi:hypothetical protein SDRG_09715 [Saprolegnia diclina VS20]|uniref:Uncharacterized protein n=1 Tax=Saprolegnia diclina (strain VS20) TaxID=1156394 RepID=T0RKA5_SAPDV|nr:hypothetical protein SDRG_09715 [Saprolegnia diclina VS20]EQC32743.1 hypothetical protein SDRG_09715 [Saprolegnia diclina VS20]|eukprot:XP_008613887.1 hypothetical protein SDRG_09715 [Saprolegnia diclina VS20]